MSTATPIPTTQTQQKPSRKIIAWGNKRSSKKLPHLSYDSAPGMFIIILLSFVKGFMVFLFSWLQSCEHMLLDVYFSEHDFVVGYLTTTRNLNFITNDFMTTSFTPTSILLIQYAK
jgi:hypothetical protein